MSFKNTFSRWAFFLLSALITLLIAAGLGYLYMEAFLPDVSALRDAELQVPLKIYTQDGNLLAEFGQMQRVPLTYDKIPPLLIDAVVATEDQRFFEHHGIDFSGLARAAWELALTGTKSQGGSTVTMQVARNFYLSREKTFGRKFNEILLALKIDRELPKEKIMELYLNKIYLGKRAYGVEAAARVYFGKPLNQLTLPELAVIAGLPKAPSAINPIADPFAAKARRDHVLERMMVEGFIDERTYKEAIAAPLEANVHPPEVTTNAPYVAEMVRNLMEASYGSDAYTQGFKVYTTVNSQLQEVANKAVREGVMAYDKRHGYRGAEANLGRYNKQSWEDALSAIDSVNGLTPAAVVQAGDKFLTVMDANGQEITLDWSALQWTKKKNARDIAKQGDVVRIESQGDRWGLSQIPKAQAALVSLDPNNGAIRALVGGFSFFDSNFNRVTQATRQPGSSFKPFIYAAAFNKGFTLASVFNDAPLSIPNPWSGEVWEPGNDDGKYWGQLRLREALAHSRNTISVRLLQALGLNYTLDYLRNFGFDSSKLPHNLTLALGTPELTPLQIAAAYCEFANGGYQVSPYIIDRVENGKGEVVYQANPKTVCPTCTSNENISEDDSNKTPGVNEEATLPNDQNINKPITNIASRVITPQVAFLVTQGMQEVVRTGTGAAVRSLGRNDLAGKTGTTNDYVDAWFSGFNGDLETTVWLGFDKPQPLNEYGAQVALPIWMQYMGAALAGKPEHTLGMPPGIVSVRIDPNTGLAVGPLGGGISEYFDENHLPQGAGPAVVTPSADDDIPPGIHPVTETPASPVVLPAPVTTPAAPEDKEQHLF
jgi:penicillin-binding protein 1A